MVNTVLRRDSVERATGLPRSTIYELMARGQFPKPIRLGARAVGWLESDVLAWQRERVAERDDPKRGGRDYHANLSPRGPRLPEAI